MEDLRIFLCSLENAYKNRYVSFSELQKIRNEKPEIPKNHENRKIRKKINYYLNKREKLNRQFIRRMQKEVFEIEGNRLDPEQIAAVVACEDAELILASAGSGKSTSLMGKVNYLVNDLKIPASEILVIAFTRKVVKELNERMGKSGVEICTFHSFGNKIIKNLKVGKELKLVPDGFLENVMTKILKTYAKDFVGIKEFGEEENLKKLLISALQLQKNEQISLKEFHARILKMKDEKEKLRAEKFFEIYARVVRIYGKILRDNRLYDFSDMLAFSTRIVNNMPKGKLKYQYVLVDEVQDLSLSKSLLLKAILDNCESVKLFAVGDDWQSIYRFAGSNLGVLNDFEKTFARKTYRGVISKTYRFGQPTAWVSEYFIRKNRAQTKKKVKTVKKTKTPIEICLTNFDNKTQAPADYEMVNLKLNELYQKIGDDLFSKRVQVISRYNKDLYRLVNFKNKKFKNAKIVAEKEDGVILDWKIDGAFKKLEVAFCSMHKSKGITRDIVFVINMNSGEKGMPSTRADEPILATMLAKPDKYPLAEERRLFYVAITRATEKTFIISEHKKISPFVREIDKNLDGEIG